MSKINELVEFISVESFPIFPSITFILPKYEDSTVELRELVSGDEMSH
jgi:hypothetical protein